MGMFDYVQVETPLPDGRTVEGPVWQSKDGPCEMGVIRITPEGRLLMEEAHSEFVPEHERPYFGKPEWDKSPWWQMAGSVRRVIDAVRDTNWHGDFNFYSGRSDNWEEYMARFTEGQLVSIRRISEPDPPQETT